MSENLFTGSPTSDHSVTAAPAPSNTPNTEDQPYLVVGDRAFHTSEDVIKKITNADEHIKKLEQEAAELRETTKRQEEALGNSANFDTLLERLNGMASNPAQVDQPGNSSAAPIDITKQVEEALTNRERTKIENDNLAIAQSPFIEGAKGDSQAAAKALADACSEVGLDLKDAQDLAKKSPNAFFRMLGVDTSNTNKPNVPDVAGGENRSNPAAVTNNVKADNFTPGSYADLKNKWKQATSTKEKKSYMDQIDNGVRGDPNFRNTT